MASESTNKRKASVPASDAAAKKVKKTDTEGAKKRKASTEIAAKPAKKTKAAASSSAPTTDKKKSTTAPAKKAAPKKSPAKKTLSSMRVSVSDDESDEIPAEEAVEEEDAGEEEEEEEVDDQTVALLAGFDSEDEDPEPTGEGFKEGGDVGKLDKNVRRKALAAQKKATDSDKPGVVYLGHIPHGFYEHEIRSYFNQFGDITRLRASRSRKTGKSKHYAFVEFKSSLVAEIVAKTMDNYLLFGHILKCKVVDPGQVHENLWKGANKRFKAVPWNKIAGRKLAQGQDEATWEKRNAVEEARRAEKAEKLKEIGYEFEAPKLKSAKDVPKTKRVDPNAALEEAEADADDMEVDQEVKAIEAVPSAEIVESSKTEVVEETTEVEPSKGKKKSKKVEKVVTTNEIEVVVEAEPTAKPSTARSKRAKKSKDAVAEETGTEKPTPALKSKKSKDTVAEEPETEKPTPALKSKKSKETVAEPATAGKAKRVRKAKASAT